VASALLITAGLLWMPIMGSDPELGQTLGLMLIAHFTFAVRVRRHGRTKARIGVTVMAVVMLFATLPYIWMGFLGSDALYGPGYAVLDIAAVAACCTGAVLLYVPASRPHFRTLK
jgi:hypothetical protein